MQRQNPRKLPENKSPTGTRCIHVEIPDDDEWERAAFSELTRLAQWFLWERNIDKDGKPVADIWLKALESWRHMCCDDGCPSTREVDGVTQYSPDGTNWYDYPGAMENPNFNNPSPYPAGTVPEGQTAQCLAAENIVTIYKEFAQKTKDVLDAVAGWVSLVAVIVTVLATIMSGGFVTAGAVAIAAAILRLADTWVTHGLDDDVVQTLRCAINCNADETGKFNPTSFDLVRTAVTAGAPVLAPIINAWLGGYGPVGLNRMAAAHINVEADCSDCDCGWCHTFDFSISDGGWSVDPTQPDAGEYLTGLYWNGTPFAADLLGGILIVKSFASAHITHVSAVYDVNISDSELAGFYYSGGNIATFFPATGDNQTFNSSCDVTTDNIGFNLNWGSNVGTGHYSHVKSITLCGDGDNPF